MTMTLYFEIYCIQANNTVYNEIFCETSAIMVLIIFLLYLGGYLS